MLAEDRNTSPHNMANDMGGGVGNNRFYAYARAEHMVHVGKTPTQAPAETERFLDARRPRTAGSSTQHQSELQGIFSGVKLESRSPAAWYREQLENPFVSSLSSTCSLDNSFTGCATASQATLLISGLGDTAAASVRYMIAFEPQLGGQTCRFEA